MTNIAVVGLGNSIMGDDGVGLAILERIQKEKFSSVTYIRGETSALSLIAQLKGFKKIIFIDAAKFGAPPGSVRVFKKEKLSLARPAMAGAHDVGLKDLLGALYLLSGFTPEAYLVGIEVGEVSLRISLSPAVKKAISPAAKCVKKLMEDTICTITE